MRTRTIKNLYRFGKPRVQVSWNWVAIDLAILAISTILLVLSIIFHGDK